MLFASETSLQSVWFFFYKSCISVRKWSWTSVNCLVFRFTDFCFHCASFQSYLSTFCHYNRSTPSSTVLIHFCYLNWLWGWFSFLFHLKSKQLIFFSAASYISLRQLIMLCAAPSVNLFRVQWFKWIQICIIHFKPLPQVGLPSKCNPWLLLSAKKSSVRSQ